LSFLVFAWDGESLRNRLDSRKVSW
jgi:hypothetical protein